MQIDLNWSSDVLAKFPELAICVGTITGIHNQKDNDQLRQLKKTVYKEVRAKYNVEALKNDPTVRAYRDFYWKLSIDPTKIRPSGEALLRRVLNGNELPSISTVVDAYNLASMQTIIPISGFDRDRLNPPVSHTLCKERNFHRNRNDQANSANGQNARLDRRKTGPVRLSPPRF
jgi:DNA/RNA-binding domain of Phe-tRNA-synthetase-like protein